MSVTHPAPRAKTLDALLAAVPGAKIMGDGSVVVTDLAEDSRGSLPRHGLRLPLRGDTFDGMQFIPEVVSKGAVALVVEAGTRLRAPSPTRRRRRPSPGSAGGYVSPRVRVLRSSRRESSRSSGVTGTNGKTSTVLHDRGDPACRGARYRRSGHPRIPRPRVTAGRRPTPRRKRWSCSSCWPRWSRPA